ncbi:hypothetical protein HI914_07396 [Erysiphe necator]|nr:hypothetical protein HI914_07396 [Erysiphe necator]
MEQSFVCHKPGCWSTRHTPEERYQAATKWQHIASSSGKDTTIEAFQQFLTFFEVIECWPEDESVIEIQQLMAEMEMEMQDSE